YLSWNNLGNVLSEMGELDAALKSYEKAHKANPAATGPFSNLITAHHYHPDKDKLEILKLCKSWGNTFASRLKEQAVETDRQPGKTLRIGMI
ncbi:hypothetical protein CVH10_20150, partial [Halomonas sp. ND22Bw]|uniref:tetratricopeptide repeat protein n=1 Tax=Halomonas sp. ND22Bw TaxID=2054178 RepID=UPI000D26616C